MNSTSGKPRQGWQSEQRDDRPLSEVLHALWERRWLVGGAVLALVVGALVFGLLQERTYRAEAVVSVSSQRSIATVGGDSEVFLQEVIGAVATDDLLEEVTWRAGWDGSLAQFNERLDVEPLVAQGGDAGSFKVRFSGTNAEEAARAANAYATLFVEKVERLNDQRIAGGSLAAEARIERPATPPERPSSPNLLLYAAAAALLGVLGSGAVALLLENKTRSWSGARDAEMTLRAPVLGVIPDWEATGPEASERSSAGKEA